MARAINNVSPLCLVVVVVVVVDFMAEPVIQFYRTRLFLIMSSLDCKRGPAGRCENAGESVREAKILCIIYYYA